jgi:hypothetical protein
MLLAPYNKTPLRCSTRASSPSENSIVVDSTPPPARRQAIKNTPPSRTPETRKRKINFQSLHNYSFQGAPPSTPKAPKQNTPIAKKARVSTIKKAQNTTKEIQSIIQEL